MISWPKVTRPKDLGGLGIEDIKRLGWALRVRWVWLKKTQPDKPWASFDLQMNGCVNALFSMAVTTEIGDGRNTLFWKDRWQLGQKVEDLAPLIYSMVPKRIANRRTVAEALADQGWIADIHGIATVPVILQFLQLCHILSDMHIQHDMQDTHIWRLSPSGQYTAKSAYDALFQGSISFEPWERIWRSWCWHQASAIFFLWLAAHNRCWAADRLAHRNLPHPSLCPLCDQEEETINHLLVACVFSRQFWFVFLQRVGLSALAPQPSVSSLEDWWRWASSSADKSLREGLNSLIILGAWQLWRHRNDCVFNGAAPSLPFILAQAGDEAGMWSMAGAKGLSLPRERSADS